MCLPGWKEKIGFEKRPEVSRKEKDSEDWEDLEEQVMYNCMFAHVYQGLGKRRGGLREAHGEQQ